MLSYLDECDIIALFPGAFDLFNAHVGCIIRAVTVALLEHRIRRDHKFSSADLSPRARDVPCTIYRVLGIKSRTDTKVQVVLEPRGDLTKDQKQQQLLRKNIGRR
ncbi:TMV resistance protein N-like [Dorcoceras hygrometricum]|uniref:TMV resistance protein N-like n=1 Tax=Dorcoceras hygrometricum TaxID=472368 RepID=A0A2Z7AMQ3_9LAMI|nr:TMV resistance protein N-like [Dorcoceras hygrometricum]